MMNDLAGFLTGRTFVRHPQADPSRSAWAYAVEAGQGAPKAALGRGGSQPLTFSGDGTFRMTVIGADDRPETVEGTWHVDPAAPTRVELRHREGQTIAVVRRAPDDGIVIDYAAAASRP
jgi:hypothetical protein